MHTTILLAQLLLVGALRAQCSSGCLMCSASDQCQLCDFTRLFYLSDGKCLSKAQPNCSLMDSKGNCLLCKPGFYPSKDTGSCVAVSDALLVPNCLAYGQTQACLACDVNFYLALNSCRLVASRLLGCAYYRDNGLCLWCHSGYTLAADGKTCVQVAATANCRFYGYLSCASCASGYVANKNSFIAQLQDQYIKGSLKADYEFVPNFKFCLAQPISPCLKQVGLNCVACPPGHQLSSNKCIPVGLAQLYQCETYTNSQNCSRCKAGYYLLNAVTCVAIPSGNIPKCLIYDPEASQIKCSQCEEGFKVVSTGKCEARTGQPIPGCAKLNPKEEKCAQCSSPKLLSTESTGCFDPISNCLSYETLATSPLKCQTCQETYTPNAAKTACEAITGKPNCAAVDSGGCTKCVQGFYLKQADKTCVQVVSVPNCQTHDQVNKNTCSVCNTGFVPFNLVKFCATATPDPTKPNCIEYNENGVCTKCQTDYYLKVGNECAAVDKSFKCASFTVDGKCASCPTNLIFIESKCEEPFKHIFDSCAEYMFNQDGNPTAMLAAACTNCGTFNLPFSFNTHKLAVCTIKAQLSSYFVTDNTDCLRFSQEVSTSAKGKCLECKQGKFLKVADNPSDQTCVDFSAKPSGTTLVADNLNGLRNAFFSLAKSNCSVLAKIKGNNDNDIADFYCIKKSGNSKAVYSFAQSTQVEAGYEYAFPLIIGESNVPETKVLYLGFNVDMEDFEPEVDGCQIYFTRGITKYCLRCQFGKYLKFTVTNSGTTTTCQDATDCNTPAFYTGLPGYLNAMLSCHVCKTAGNFPYLRLSLKKDQADKKYIGDIVNTAVHTNADDKANSNCEKVAAALLVPNCLVYGIITDTTNNDKQNTACLACRPGFRPRTYYNVVFSQEVTACVPIKGCNMSAAQTIANACEQCSTLAEGGRLVYLAFSDYKQEHCYRTRGPNCYVADKDQKCQVCYPGFWVNAYGVCDSLSIPYCADAKLSQYQYSHFPDSFTEAKVKARMHYTLSAFGKLYGCGTCNTGYTGVLPSQETKICIPSSYIKDNFNKVSGYVQGCVAFKVDLTKCVSCAGGLLPDKDGNNCIRQPPFCKAIDSADNAKCGTCIDGYTPVGGQCVPKLIDHCKEYNNAAAAVQECSTCEDGFYKTSTHQCLPGSVSNCKTYEAEKPEKCTACQDFFQLYQLETDRFYCFPIGTEGNQCKELDSNTDQNLKNGKFVCTKCNQSPKFYKPKENSVLDSELSQLNSICLAFTKIPNCATYEPAKEASGNANANAFLCSKCEADYYPSANKRQCIKRSPQPASCTEKKDDADECKTCGGSTYLDAGTKGCSEYPKGVARCSVYSDTNVCSVCSPPYYQTSGACVLSGTVVDGCKLYSGDNACSACFPGFVLESNKCVQATAQNCLTYSSKTACATCDPSSDFPLLFTDGSVTNCVGNYWKDCKEFQSTYPPACKACQKNQFLGSGGFCLPVTAPIGGCVDYASADTCSACATGLLLAVDKKSCLSQYFGQALDQFCEKLTLAQTPFCLICQPGFFLADDGTCTACSGNAVPAKGCSYCNKADPTKCTVCMSSYFQNKEGLCLPSQIFGKTTVTAIPTDSLNLKFAGLSALWWAVLVLLGLIAG